MTDVNRRLKRSTAEGESGFTLIELLIVIVVLGILAAIVVFALSGVTGKSITAACQSDAKTVGVAVSALQAENPTAYQGYNTTTWRAKLVLNSNSTGGLTGGPFLQSWPNGNSSSYKIEVAHNTTTKLTGNTTIAPSDGDIIVIPQKGVSINKTFDATQVPSGNSSGCQNLS